MQDLPVLVSQKAAVYNSAIRGRDWIGYLAITIAGYAFGISSAPISALDHWLFLRTILAGAFCLSFTFLINNYSDIENDRLNPQKVSKNPMARGMMHPKEALALCATMIVLGSAIVVTTANLASVFIYSLLVALGWAYSAPPLRLKGRPALDLVSHGFMLGTLLFFFGHSIVTSETVSLVSQLVGASMFTRSIMCEMQNHLRDASADAQSGTLTTVGWLGEEKSRRLLMAITILHLGLLGFILMTVSSMYVIYLAPAGLTVMSQSLSISSLTDERADNAVGLVTVLVTLIAAVPGLRSALLI